MKIRTLALLPILLAAACSSEPVRLFSLRSADQGSQELASYQRLEEAVMIANEFLATSTYARGFPAEQAQFSVGLNDLLLHLAGEGIVPMRIETTGWGDLRTIFGDGVHPNDQGFLTARRTNMEATGNGSADAAFLQLGPTDMAALLLRQAAIMREVQARGEFDYWLNYDLLGLNPSVGWMDGNVVDRRAYAVQDGFYQWVAQRNDGYVAENNYDTGATEYYDPYASEENYDTYEVAESIQILEPVRPRILDPVDPPGGGNYPGLEFP